jgi:putative PIN family toxin of toxin-antitoxin system
MRVVFDTDVVVAALRSPSGASAALLFAAAEGRLVPCANVALMIEYEATCLREEHVVASGLSREDVGVFLDGLAVVIEPVDTHFLWRPQLRDPGDEMVLEAAVNGKAGTIVTFNVRDYGSAAGRFGVRVSLPREVLKLVKG